jgi:predicted metal-dependent phosphoesterase TrpH
MVADLHLHTTASDGTDTPNEIVHMAIQHGLKAIAITDHDTIDGYKWLSSDAMNHLRILPAIEVSTAAGHRSVHILGYGIDINSDCLSKYMLRASEEKTENTLVNFQHAQKLGVIDYPWEQVLRHFPDQRRISGVHVVRAMETDHVKAQNMSLWELFHLHFHAKGEAFIATETLTGRDAINVIKASGGIPVVAHPAAIGNDDTVASLIACGAEGLEAYHPIHSKADEQRYLDMAQKHSLYISGGTDWHGGNNGLEVTHFAMRGLKDSDSSLLQALK